jgi:hypothetical protein
MASPSEPHVVDDRADECPDCGGPVEADVPRDKPYRICHSCYAAPVENAGR